jgi:hypothetical protein
MTGRYRNLESRKTSTRKLMVCQMNPETFSPRVSSTCMQTSLGGSRNSELGARGDDARQLAATAHYVSERE